MTQCPHSVCSSVTHQGQVRCGPALTVEYTVALAYFSLKIQPSGIPVGPIFCHLGVEHLFSQLSGYGMLLSIPTGVRGGGGEGNAVEKVELSFFKKVQMNINNNVFFGEIAWTS